MAQAKKFGVFSGVFTPSILTILGVIMYLRLPWIVGQAGLWNTIAIIVVAHIISVTTGLSVSSIATDKKVKAGGSYYILSRSLGLPIGGMLGLALFVGLSFSVSLYLIGFSESLLGVLDIAVTPNSIRVAGTLALIALATITFISTSLALKTQFFVLAAIVLSLISIFFANHDLQPAATHVNPLPQAVGWMVLFGIFFPAVTGFEAGVSMSGDLKDPKKSIPGGTIAAIAVGLVVYIGLAVFLAYTVDPNALSNDPDVLLKISFFAPLVTAGILAATFSSAMGSILGAPRILQATSVDKITPKFFAKGHGKENEPRNALLLTFLIAESGILIGELNVIARVVSMFFITTYGFLNLSAALESWASTDFRPDFKIPKSVSIIGSLACFIVMIQLDFLGMIGATTVMGGIFLYLKRKELTLESGDTWEGVWSSVVRTGLYRLTRGVTHQRNWRPNIILFSGGVAARPHLVELGKWLIHKRGVLSDFELVENPKRKNLQPRAKQMVPDGGIDSPGIFTRRLEVDNIYDGMENICQIYGFSGMEPNTALLGWARNTRDPERFAHLISALDSLDYNVLLLNYNENRGYGDKKQVDIWWRGMGNNISLALSLIRFLASTDDWEETTVRLLIVNEENSLTGTIYKNANLVLEDYRIEAEVKVVQNGIEQRSFEEIIKTESHEADLVILGLPTYGPREASRFVNRINSIRGELGTILLVWASSYFNELYVGYQDKAPQQPETAAGEISETALPELILPADDRIAHLLNTLDSRLEAALLQYKDHFLKRIEKVDFALIDALNQLINRVFDNLEKNLDDKDTLVNRKLMSRSHSDFLFHSQQILTEFQQKQLTAQKEAFEEGVAWLLQEISTILEGNPETLAIHYQPADFQVDTRDSFYLRIFKFRKRLKARLTRKGISQEIRLRNLLKYYLQYHFPESWYGELQKFGTVSYQEIADIQKLLNSMREGLLRVESGWMQDDLDKQDITTECENAEKQVVQLKENLHTISSAFHNSLRRNTREYVQSMSRDLQRIEINREIKTKYQLPKLAKVLQEKITEMPERWAHHRGTYLNIALLDLLLMSLQNRIRVIVQRIRQDINLNIEANLLQPLEKLCSDLNSTLEAAGKTKNPAAVTPEFNANGAFRFEEEETVRRFFGEIREATGDLPETIYTFSEDAFNSIAAEPFEEAAIFTISLRRLVEYLIEEDFINPLRDYLEDVPEQFQKAENVARDVIRLVSFHLENSGTSEQADENDDPRDNMESVVKNSKERMIKECRNIEEIHTGLNDTIERLLNSAFEKMNTYSVTRSAGNLQHYIRAREGQKVLSKVEVAREGVVAFLKDKLVRLWYQRSEGLLVARKLQAEDSRQNRIHRLLNLREALSPNPAVINSLPFYYRQLFSAEPNIHPNFWIGRKKELQLAETAFKRFTAGFSGGLLVTGEENSGKTSLCYYAANKHFKKQNIYSIFPPPGGSIETSVFRESVLSALRANGLYLRGKLSQVFNDLPQDSVMIFNDIEQWWERSENGFEIIDTLIDLVNKFSYKCFFMVNANLHSFQLINKIQAIEDNFLGMIECQPFDAEELKDIILLRHRSTGLKIELNEQSEDEISEWKLAKLFNGFFDYTRGNVGVALQSWLSHIQKISKDRLIMREPDLPGFSPLEDIEKESLILIIQVLLHKRLSRQRLARIMGENEKNIQQPINNLKRSGLLIENAGGVLEIDPYIHPHLKEKLRQMEMI